MFLRLLFLIRASGGKLAFKSQFLVHFCSMHIDAYCNTEATTSLIRQHIPAASLIQENTQQLVYTLPLRDMDKFAGIVWGGVAVEEKSSRNGCSLQYLSNCHSCICFFLAEGQAVRFFIESRNGWVGRDLKSPSSSTPARGSDAPTSSGCPEPHL